MQRTDLVPGRIAAWLIVLCAASSCSNTKPPPETEDCASGKCDTPFDKEDYCDFRACADRAGDAADPRLSAVTDAIRWPCADVAEVTSPLAAGVKTTKDARGQEYCEYFALIDGTQIDPGGPDEGSMRTGKLHGWTLSEFASDEGQARGDPFAFDPSKLSETQRSWLAAADNASEVVGSCVFTSWSSDVTEAARAPELPRVHTFPIIPNLFRLHGQFNHNYAAFVLLVDALLMPRFDAETSPVEPEAQTLLGDLFEQHPFYRGCMQARLLAFPWRTSDSTIAATVARMAECGCRVVDAKAGAVKLPAAPASRFCDPTQLQDRVKNAGFTATPEQLQAACSLAEVMMPTNGQYADGRFLRGFPLGSWNAVDKLPAGCRYVQLDPGYSAYPEGRTHLTGTQCLRGDGTRGLCENDADTQTLVLCDITAKDLGDPAIAGEVKEFCRTRYGRDLIVHIPLPVEPDQPHLECDASCSDKPWLLESKKLTDAERSLVDQACTAPPER